MPLAARRKLFWLLVLLLAASVVYITDAQSTKNTMKILIPFMVLYIPRCQTGMYYVICIPMFVENGKQKPNLAAAGDTLLDVTG